MRAQQSNGCWLVRIDSARDGRPPAAETGRLTTWWRTLELSALAMATALSPGSYDRAMRQATAHQIYLSGWQALPGFLLACAVLGFVLIRIVADTARDFGQSQYALELSVRVLVLELIPLLAALSVALRSGAAIVAEVALMHVRGAFDEMRTQERDPLRHALAPRVFGAMVAVMVLAWTSSAIVMLIAYTSTYGLSPWGIAQYLRVTGQVFGPATVLGLVLKTLIFGMAVAAIPIGAALAIPRQLHKVPGAVMNGMVRLGMTLVVIEVAFLAVTYA